MMFVLHANRDWFEFQFIVSFDTLSGHFGIFIHNVILSGKQLKLSGETHTLLSFIDNCDCLRSEILNLHLSSLRSIAHLTTMVDSSVNSTYLRSKYLSQPPSSRDAHHR